jgi:hypothetical protein
MTTGCMLLSLAASMAGQERTRYVELKESEGGLTSPIEIVEIRVGSKKSADNHLFAGPGWLKALEVTVKNISDLTIIRIELNAILFNSSRPDIRYRASILHFGASPNASEAQREHFTVLKKNESATIKVRPDPLPWAMQMFEKASITEVDHAILEQHVLFEDRTGYDRGFRMCPTGSNSWNMTRTKVCPSK